MEKRTCLFFNFIYQCQILPMAEAHRFIFGDTLVSSIFFIENLSDLCMLFVNFVNEFCEAFAYSIFKYRGFMKSFPIKRLGSRIGFLNGCL